jgi:hypothetical protein
VRALPCRSRPIARPSPRGDQPYHHTAGPYTRGGGPCRPSSVRGGGRRSSSSAGPSSACGRGCSRRHRSGASGSAWRSSTGPASGRTPRPRAPPERGEPGRARPARGARPLARRARDQGARRRRRGRTGRGPHGRAGPSPRAADRAGAPRPAAARAALGRRRPGLQLARPPRPDPVRARGARPAIPTRSNEAAVACPDFIYTNRNLVERLWARLKERRAVATRYEKTAASFTGVLCLAAALDWLKP